MLLLAVLAAGPAHGYAVMFQARGQRSAGAFELPEGTVDPALHRLESAGLLASTWEIVAGRRRRMYQLTAGGRGGADGPGAAVAGLHWLGRAGSAQSCSQPARRRPHE